MVKPERRTRGDVLAAAAIAAVVAVVGRPDLVDQRRQGHDQPARRDAGADPAHRQGGARVPAAAVDGAEPEDDHAAGGGGSVVTGDGHEVEGRDPATGNTLWSYARDLDLCGVT